MPVRVSFDDGNWPSQLASVISRSTYYTLAWKEHEVLVHFENNGHDPTAPSYPEPYEDGFEDGASS